MTIIKSEILSKFRKNPIGFATRVLGVTPELHQGEILNSIRDRRRTLVVSCNSIGKDFIAGVAVHHFLQVYEKAQVITTAPTGEQVRDIQWKEIRARFKDSLIPLGGHMPEVEPVYRINTSRFAIGLATRDEVERLAGHHEEHLLIIITEGSAVSDEIYHGIRSLMASGDVHLLVLTNPTRNEGEVWEITSGNRAGWNIIQISGFDLPNLKACEAMGADHMALSAEDLEELDECPNPSPYLISHHFEAECREDFGVESDYYAIHVKGVHGLFGSDQLIPRPWIDEAFAREAIPDGKLGAGLDIAKPGGRDQNAFCLVDGNVLKRLVQWRPEGPTSTEETIERDYLKEDPKLPLAIDDTGLGGGVAGHLSGPDHPRVFGVDFSTKADDQDDGTPSRFANKPAQMYFEVRRRLDPDGENPLSFASVPIHMRKKFISHLCRPRFMSDDSRGRLRVDKKGGSAMSPDMFDGLALALEAQGKFLWSGLPVDTGPINSEDEFVHAPEFAGLRERVL